MTFSRPVAGRIGLFGGTFDPIHFGHLFLAEQARIDLRLDAILFVPASIPPHKLDRTDIASGHVRREMVESAISSNPSFSVTDIELVRSGPSYTVDTLLALQEAISTADFTLLIGADNAREFGEWHEPEKILDIADVAVWRRPGDQFEGDIFDGRPARIVDAPLIEISSTEIRRRTMHGISTRYFTTDEVRTMIEREGLYR